MGYTIGVTVLILLCALLAFFSGHLLDDCEVESRALGSTLLIVCIMLGCAAIAVVGFHNEYQEYDISASRAEYIDYNKIDIQETKKNGEISEITFTYNGETIHLPLKGEEEN